MKPSLKLKSGRRGPRAPQSSAALRGDIARAMFARWERDHADPRPMTWEKFRSKLEENRLRDAPLFAK